jgi:hypothetical protein
MSLTSLLTNTWSNAPRKTVVPVVIVILLVLAGLFGIGGYVGSDQAIGNKPEWRKMVHSPAEYSLSSETVTLQSTDGVLLKAWWLPAPSQNQEIAT